VKTENCLTAFSMRDKEFHHCEIYHGDKERIKLLCSDLHQGSYGNRKPSLSIQKYFLVEIDEWEEKEVTSVPNGLIICFESYECPFDLYCHLHVLGFKIKASKVNWIEGVCATWVETNVEENFFEGFLYDDCPGRGRMCLECAISQLPTNLEISMREDIVKSMEDRWEQRSWTDSYADSDSDNDDFNGKCYTKCRSCGKNTEKYTE